MCLMKSKWKWSSVAEIVKRGVSKLSTVDVPPYSLALLPGLKGIQVWERVS